MRTMFGNKQKLVILFGLIFLIMIACTRDAGEISRRKEILAQGRRMGFSEFHIHLLIAQVQFGGNLVVRPMSCRDSVSSAAAARIGARFAAAGVLALALFLAMVRWLGA